MYGYSEDHYFYYYTQTGFYTKTYVGQANPISTRNMSIVLVQT